MLTLAVRDTSSIPGGGDDREDLRRATIEDQRLDFVVVAVRPEENSPGRGDRLTVCARGRDRVCRTLRQRVKLIEPVLPRRHHQLPARVVEHDERAGLGNEGRRVFVVESPGTGA